MTRTCTGGHKFITLALYTPLTDIKARLKARSVLTAAHSHVSLASAAVMHAAMSTAATKDWEMPHIHTQHSNGDRYVFIVLESTCALAGDALLTGMRSLPKLRS